MGERIGASVVAGLMAGIVFGMIMEGTSAPMIGMIGQILAGHPSMPVGWIFHLFYSAILGGIFGWVLGDRAHDLRAGLAWGAAYGFALWVIGGLILLPLLLGMPPFAPLVRASLRTFAIVSLLGHFVFGVVMGLIVGAYCHIPDRGQRVAS